MVFGYWSQGTNLCLARHAAFMVRVKGRSSLSLRNICRPTHQADLRCHHPEELVRASNLTPVIRFVNTTAFSTMQEKRLFSACPLCLTGWNVDRTEQESQRVAFLNIYRDKDGVGIWITINPFRSYVGSRPTLWFSCSRRFSWSVTLSNPIFLPPTYSPALIYFGRERGWWVTCNYPTVLKEKIINRNRKSTTCAICWLKSVLHEKKRREQENHNVGLRTKIAQVVLFLFLFMFFSFKTVG
jgi:hypothetical protein